jgi:hypothetical protein
MSILLILLFPSLFVPLIYKFLFNKDIEINHVLIIMGISLSLVLGTWFGIQYHALSSSEIWNGQVIKKYHKKVSCEHSYSCNCHSTKNGTSCDICYEHPYDIDWDLDTTTGDIITIDRIDDQGRYEPPRFSKAKIGDPVAHLHHFLNYIQGAQDSLFYTDKQNPNYLKYKKLIPKYPDKIYDYQYINRVLVIGSIPSLSKSLIQQWNTQLADILRPLGPKKQVNIILIFTSIQDQELVHAIRTAWLGGKKNDVILVLSTPDYPKIGWAKVISWTDNEDFKVQLADALSDQSIVDPIKTLNLVNDYVSKQFQRKQMKDFYYLKWESQPSPSECVIIFLLDSLFLFFSLTKFTRD